jgi:hypothetical protein
LNQAYLFGAVAIATLATAAYLYLSDSRVPVSSGTAFLTWGYVSLNGGSAEKVLRDGTVVDVPMPEELRLLAALLALVSFFALAFSLIGVYPPEREGEGDESSERFAFGD